MREVRYAVPFLLLLAGCHGRQATITADTSDNAAGAPANATATPNSLSVDVPGFKAQVSLPSISLSGDDTNIDGMKLYPGTKLTGMKVAQSAGEKDGDAIMSYTADAKPGAVLAYYRSAATAAGYTLASSAPGAVSGTKGNKARFTVVAHATASGTQGTLSAAGD